MSVNDKEKTRQIKFQPSRWQTKEFYFYYVCFCIVVPYMFKITYNLSQSNHPNYPEYESLLSEGWILGRQVDNSDAQYSQFRDHIPKLIPLVIAHLIFSHANRRYFQFSVNRFSLFLSFVCVLLLHGSSAIKLSPSLPPILSLDVSFVDLLGILFAPGRSI
ncbi:unnamed protein product [Rhizopus stolonifer]